VFSRSALSASAFHYYVPHNHTVIEDGDDDGDMIIPIAAGGGGAFVLMVIIIAVCCYCKRKKTHQAGMDRARGQSEGKYMPESEKIDFEGNTMKAPAAKEIELEAS
jgi:hypothetical protein